MGGCYDRLGQEISLGALLVVRPEQMAMVFRAPAAIAALKDCDCSTVEGDVFGPGSHELRPETLRRVSRHKTREPDTPEPWQTEVFFCSTALMQGSWHSDTLVLPLIAGSHIEVRAHGGFRLRVQDPRAFLLSRLEQAACIDFAPLEQEVQQWLKQYFAVHLLALDLHPLQLHDSSAFTALQAKKGIFSGSVQTLEAWLAAQMQQELVELLYGSGIELYQVWLDDFVCSGEIITPVQPVSAEDCTTDLISATESDTTRTLRCRGCGGRLQFDVEQKSLRCQHCAREQALAGPSSLPGHDYEAWIACESDSRPAQAAAVQCPNCGGSTTLPAAISAQPCPICGTSLIKVSTPMQLTLPPDAIIAFAVNEAALPDLLHSWARQKRMAPNDLKRRHRMNANPQGIYVACWVFEARTRTRYTGKRVIKRGKHEHYKKVEGELRLLIDDEIVPAGSSKAGGRLQRLAPWPLHELRPYADQFIAGFTVTAGDSLPSKGYARALPRMEARIKEAIERDIGGDAAPIITSMEPAMADVRFKHILLPVWVGSYQYGGKNWPFYVNGQTGAVWGEYPESRIKRFLVRLLMLLLLAGVLWILLFG